jgi:hypothetical protein
VPESRVEGGAGEQGRSGLVPGVEAGGVGHHRGMAR